MITILFHMAAKAGLEDECIRVARDVMARTRAEDHGCISYAFYRRSDTTRASSFASNSGRILRPLQRT